MVKRIADGLLLSIGYLLGSVLVVVGLLTGKTSAIAMWLIRAGGSVSFSTSSADLYRGCAIVRLDKCEMLGEREGGWYAFGALPIPLNDEPFATERECKDFVHATIMQTLSRG